MAEAYEDAAGDEDFRCSAWTAHRGFDPIGSAPSFDRLVAVEIPQPWPRDVGEMDWVSSVEVPFGTRVQAIVPEVGRLDGSVMLTRWERRGAVFEGIDWLVAAADVHAAIALLVTGDDPAGAVSAAPAEVLVCGHGSRDRCCGGAGTRLAIEVRAALPGMRVRRTSHLGGHRFAPTALTLPDGRVWAHLDAELLSGIVARTLAPPTARQHYRGNVGLDPWAQVVEGQVLADSGWDAIDFDQLSATTDTDGEHATVELTWTSRSSTDERIAHVEIATWYPVLQCGLAPSEATKTSPEYRLA